MEIAIKGYSIDLDDVRWFAGSGPEPARANQVEVAFVGEAIAVRDAQNPDGPALIFTPAEWDAFVGGAKDGEFDL
jgi:hypothetical protein